MERMDRLADAWERNRPDLLRYVKRLLVDFEAAEDVVQQAALRAMGAASAPDGDLEVRKWLFRIATNLAIDQLRRRRLWSESALWDARKEAESDPAFVEWSLTLRGSPEVSAIAQQHLAFCFACVLRSLAPSRAAALLLTEVYGFTVQEAAGILDASRNQVKNWLQEARAAVAARHADRCALIEKKGVCYQCVELAAFFTGTSQDPLAWTDGTIDDRIPIVRAVESDFGVWHRRLLDIVKARQGGEGVTREEDPDHS